MVRPTKVTPRLHTSDSTWHPGVIRSGCNTKLQSEGKFLVTYVGDPYAKFHHDMITHLATQICKNEHQVARLVLWFFRCSLQPRTLNTALICTINMWNDVVSCKDIPSEGPKKKLLHFDPIFLPKWKFLANFR